DLVNLICEVISEVTEKPISNYKKLITFVKDRPGHDKRYALSIEKIKRELGWNPTEDFKEAMKKTVKWFVDKFAIGG
ncbi:MAG: GDP-mannose 4,6-dehydratase, partial [Desulfurella sp.]